MILSTPEELRLYLPTHVLDNIDNVRGALDNSEHDFLRERIGAPLLARLSRKYSDTYIDSESGLPALPAIESDLLNYPTEPWPVLITLCQRCVVFDAFSRMADIMPLSVHDAGINVVETKGYDAAPEKAVAAYKLQMQKEAHAAANRLLIQLEEWQQEVAQASGDEEPSDDAPTPEPQSTPDDEVQQGESDAQSTEPTESEPTEPTASGEQEEEESGAEPEPSAAEEEEADPRVEIVALWKESAYYYYADGLLFNTATDFDRFVNIYESREKFIQLVPDIRYCQETNLETELGEELLSDLIEKRRTGQWNATERKAYIRLQRTLSLMVEARNPMFKRAAASDEAVGQLCLALDYIRKNQKQFNREAMEQSPLYDADLWRETPSAPLPPPPPPFPHRAHVEVPPLWPSRPEDDHGMLISSII